MQESIQIFITGATGLVGKEILEKLLGAGFKIIASKRPTSLIEILDNNLTWIDIDLLDLVSLEQAISSCHLIVHCAALVTFAPKKFDSMYQTNVEGTKNIVNLCLKYSKKLIYISSVAALGRGKDLIISEDCTWSDSDSNSYYAKTKYLAELEVWRGIEEGLEATIFSPSVVLGIGKLDKSSTKLFKYVLDEKSFYSTGNINYVDVKDIAEMVLKNIHNPIYGQRFILNAGAISYQDFFVKIASRLNSRPPSIKVNLFLAGVAWRVEYLKSIFSKNEPLITKETAKLSFSKYVFLAKKAEISFNHQFKNINESLDRCCKEIIEKQSQN